MNYVQQMLDWVSNNVNLARVDAHIVAKIDEAAMSDDEASFDRALSLLVSDDAIMSQRLEEARSACKGKMRKRTSYSQQQRPMGRMAESRRTFGSISEQEAILDPRDRRYEQINEATVLTRQHFTSLASKIATMDVDRRYRVAFVTAILPWLQSTNPAFRTNYFLTACGLPVSIRGTVNPTELTEATMTRKHFVELAAIVRAIEAPLQVREEMVQVLISWCREFNPRFDARRFAVAAGVPSIQMRAM